jgi:hypothetical protein
MDAIAETAPTTYRMASSYGTANISRHAGPVTPTVLRWNTSGCWRSKVGGFPSCSRAAPGAALERGGFPGENSRVLVASERCYYFSSRLP